MKEKILHFRSATAAATRHSLALSLVSKNEITLWMMGFEPIMIVGLRALSHGCAGMQALGGSGILRLLMTPDPAETKFPVFPPGENWFGHWGKVYSDERLFQHSPVRRRGLHKHMQLGVHDCIAQN